MSKGPDAGMLVAHWGPSGGLLRPPGHTGTFLGS